MTEITAEQRAQWRDGRQACATAPTWDSQYARVVALCEALDAAEQIAARAAADTRESVLSEVERAIITARDALHHAFSEGNADLPRGYTNAARIVRDLQGGEDR